MFSYEIVSILKELRQKLSITREELAQLLGVTISSLNHWEYRKILPTLLYQDMILQLYSNADKVKIELNRNKGEYLALAITKKYKSKDDFLTKSNGDILGCALIGAMALLIKALSDTKERDNDVEICKN